MGLGSALAVKFFEARAEAERARRGARTGGDPIEDRRIAGEGLAVCETAPLLILTAARSGEVRGTTWEEIDSDVWIVSAERMKAGREHHVPLSAPALRLLEAHGKARLRNG